MLTIESHRGVARRTACTLCLCLSFTVSLPVSATTREISLQDAVRLAVDQAPMLDARRAGVTAAQQDAARAGALPDPMLTVGIDNLPVTGSDAFNTGADFMTMKKIGLRQEIPARAKRDARQRLATRQVDEAVAQSEAERLDVRRSAADAWTQLWTAQQQLLGLQRLRQQAALVVSLAKARLAGGDGSAGDALASKAALLELDSRIEAARADSQSAQAGLARWIGDADVDATTDAVGFNELPVSEAGLLARIDRLAPLLTASAQLETAAAAVDVARAERHPDWSVGASYGQREHGRDDMLTFEIGVGLPLFTRDRQDRGVAAREADYQAALASREDRHRQEVARVRADIARWQGLKRQIALYRDSLLPLAHDRSQATLAAYRAGGALQPWLDSRRDDLDAQLVYAQQLGALAQAWIALAYLLPMEKQP
ncbi:TolC family protein [Cognatiluteimonas profundi]|uniref:TolC family protein n=1 Tax=Cognatiluteimonas profundi TaxID=2594501 RepID=UPI00131E130B|nr:TolC family protein [Lysobacter profundi]